MKQLCNYKFSLFFFFLNRLERSKVRVSIYHGSQPQQVSPPENYNYFKDSFNFDTFSSDTSVVDDMTTATATTVNYDRQQR